ncbi:methionyl-tRNA formyltransferase [Facklamia sp. DSM 111018]|uniref:Methionyl-tRNA formyltransferase n=1 Tax=Facklamia lactis TaxID=2749967 RepID=A0ABS0LMY6_9LACT|nr:methionyl-tRNA formyltransferase [Facklamia lactis]MBG9979795.1 methionyl-tRNA formyltransferase [Facklamia lactis]MBG9985525.1 methionyl-tRNA formyltransferase [Facklamia lactis]
MKKIIFMGTPKFAATILEGLIKIVDYDIVAVVTQPDRPVGRKRLLTPPPVKEMALEHNLLVLQPEQLKESNELDELMKIEADIIVTAAYGQKIPIELLNRPEYGAVNVHASLLPKYRGGAPIHYAIWQGQEETGVTIMQMSEEMDAGAIYKQAPLPINDQDDVGILFGKLAIMGRELLLDTLPRIFDHQLQAYDQPLDQVTYAPTIKKEEEELNWQETAYEIDRHIRAFRPFPTTYTLYEGQRVKIWQAYPLQRIGELSLLADQKPGTIIGSDEESFYVQCGQGTVLKVTEYQASGKKRMPVKNFMKGSPIEQMLGNTFHLKGNDYENKK